MREGQNKCYASITTAPEKLLFIGRVVAGSRTVALNPTSRFSTLPRV